MWRQQTLDSRQPRDEYMNCRYPTHAYQHDQPSLQQPGSVAFPVRQLALQHYPRPRRNGSGLL